VSIVPVTISTFQYLRITYTNGTVQDVGPLTSTAYTATAPITIVGNTISLATVPVASGGTGLTSLTAGYIPFGNNTSAFGSSANLFWDSANSRLGIGTNSPTAPLHVSGANLSTSAFKFVSTTGTNAVLGQFTNSGGTAYIGLDSDTVFLVALDIVLTYGTLARILLSLEQAIRSVCVLIVRVRLL